MSSNNNNNTRLVDASPSDFADCNTSEAQYVQVPVVQHTKIQQPVTYTMYKKTTSYVSVPVVQNYKKATLSHQELSTCGEAPVAVAAAAQMETPVYGCGAGPFAKGAGEWSSSVQMPGAGVMYSPQNYFYQGVQQTLPAEAYYGASARGLPTSYAAMY